MADRASPQKHLWRAGIALATAGIMRRTGKSKPESGAARALHAQSRRPAPGDKTREPGKAPLPPKPVRRTGRGRQSDCRLCSNVSQWPSTTRTDNPK